MNAYKFNGSVIEGTESKKAAGLGMEEIQDHGLNIYHAFYRTYDPVIGRMMQVDPLAEQPDLISMTPYNAFLNIPISFSDPNGDFAGTIGGVIVGGIAGGIIAYKNKENVLAGIAKGGTEGFIVGAAIDLTVASGGGLGPLVTAGLLSGGIGHGMGDLAGQTVENMLDNGMSFKEASNADNLDFDVNATDMAVSMGAGGLGGLATHGANLVKTAFKTSTDEVVSTVNNSAKSGDSWVKSTGAATGESSAVVSANQSKIATGYQGASESLKQSAKHGPSVIGVTSSVVSKAVIQGSSKVAPNWLID